MGTSVRRREEMLRHVMTWEKSGQTQSEYCKRHGLSYYSFDYWRGQALKGQPSVGKNAFIPVVPKISEAMSCDNPVEVVLREGVSVRWPTGRPIEELAQLLRGLLQA